MASLGDALTLWDLAWRVVGFINDVRHAQDDFISLKSEAHCLLICIHSLKSETCLRMLYRVGDGDQRSDLKRIIAMTEHNMKDLNAFIADCKVMVKNEAKRQGWFGLKGWLAKGWATLKWTMTDKQPFRDKLVLPAQSINIFLTSLTVVGVGRGLKMGFSPGGSTKDVSIWSEEEVEEKEVRLREWANVGENVAFRERFGIKGAVMTLEMEDEVVLYVLHLLRGGKPFYKLGDGKHKHKVEKKVVTKTRSRSRSRGPLSVGKGNNTGNMYVMRKKSEYKPASERVQIVTNEWESDDESTGRPLLALPAPGGDDDSVIEIKPKSSGSDDDDSGNGSDGDDGVRKTGFASGRSSGRARRTTRRERTESWDEERRASGRSSRRAPYLPTDDELEERKRRVERQIADEQMNATTEMLDQANLTEVVVDRPASVRPGEEERYREDVQIAGSVEYMERVYGISIALVGRDPIDSGKVKLDATTSSYHRTSLDEDVEMSEADDLHHDGFSTESKTRARHASQLKAETYMSAEVEGLGPIRSRRRREYSRFEPYGGSRYRPTSYYESLGVRPAPLYRTDEDFEGRPHIFVDSEYSPHRGYPRRTRRAHEEDERATKLKEEDLRRRKRASSPDEFERPRFEVTSHFSDDEEYRGPQHNEFLEVRRKDDTRRRETGPESSYRDMRRTSEDPKYDGPRLRKTASYGGHETRPQPPDSRQRRTSHRQDEYMTGARHSDDSDDPSDISGLVVPKPRR